MPHRIAAAVATFALMLTGCQAWADVPPAAPAGRVDILVDGRSRPALDARGTWYIEALKGRPYAIRLRNPYAVRVAVALAVDGLNTIDGRHTSASAARKWVIEPYGTVVISGWQTSLSDARRFEFTTEARSYGASLGRTSDLGVIAAVFFRERVRPPVIVTSREEKGRGYDAAPPVPAAPSASGAGAANSAPGRPAAEAPAQAKAQAEAADYAATGMGGRIDHAVTEVSLDLEPVPAFSVAIRYEYRAELVRLGVVPREDERDGALDRRERAKGFAPGFCPEPRRWD